MKKKQSEGLKHLKHKLGSGVVVTDEASLYRASMDNARLSFMPDAVVFPKKNEDIETLLQLANRFKVPVTTRGAGSATTGATSPICGGWVLDLSRWKKIKIDTAQGVAVAQAGVTIDAMNAAAEKKGWFYPPDPSSKKYSTVGGNVANNAGGLRGAKYGVTRDYVLGLEGFLASGEFVRWGSPLKKFASGYNMRDLWVGSEGTLGIVTEATLKLLPKPASKWTGLVAFKNEADALRAAQALMKARIVPSIMEFLDRQTVECTTRRLGRPIFKACPDVALLLIELDGKAQSVTEDRRVVIAWAKERGLCHRETRDPEKAEALWEVRRTCSQAMFQMGDTKLNEDIVVPVKSYLPLLRYTLQLRKETGLATPTFGHVADGNFHVHLMYFREDATQRKAAEKGVSLLMKKVIELGGVITGEHGVGLAKSPFLHLQHTAAEIRAMKAIKKTLDPNSILNPGKIFEPFEIWNKKPDYDAVFPWQKH